jgi:hypothetical protein
MEERIKIYKKCFPLTLKNIEDTRHGMEAFVVALKMAQELDGLMLENQQLEITGEFIGTVGHSIIRILNVPLQRYVIPAYVARGLHNFESYSQLGIKNGLKLAMALTWMAYKSYSNHSPEMLKQLFVPACRSALVGGSLMLLAKTGLISAEKLRAISILISTAYGL